MTKTQFRLLVVVSFLMSIICGIWDMVVQNETVGRMSEYYTTLEAEWSDTKMILMTGYFLLALVWTFYTFLGLLLFWNSARHIYLLGFIVFLPMYWVAEVIVSSGVAQTLCDTAMVLSGFILALIYYSPVQSYFIKKSTPAISPTNEKAS